MAFTASDICKVRVLSLISLDFLKNLVVQIIFAVLLPPLGVFLERGCGADFVSGFFLFSEHF